jgi:hypothetical protein
VKNLLLYRASRAYHLSMLITGFALTFLYFTWPRTGLREARVKA